uniref:Uncharacterized protein LOC111099749 n=1 Tax=Crassostrea virginica TaxID=6565 RepID=A0A8B8A6V9_CRAVI|nr:uncharacterized protein LOC111099749 [Crassostrea virginica]
MGDTQNKGQPVPKPRTIFRKCSEGLVLSHNWSSFHGRSHQRRSSVPSIQVSGTVRGVPKPNVHALPTCQDHPSYRYEQYCPQCDVPACAECVSSGRHSNHDVQNISNVYEMMRDIVFKDTHELESFILPFYDTVMSDIETTHKVVASQHQERKKTIKELGNNLHKIVDDITEKYLKEENDMEADDMKNIQCLEMRFLKLRNQVRGTVEENQTLLDNKDFQKIIGQLLNYTSRNQLFRDVPERYEMVVADFNPKVLTEKDFVEMIGRLGVTQKKSINRHRLPVLRKDFDKSIRKPSSSHANQVMGKIQTGFTRTARVACSLRGHQLYVCGDSNVIKTFSGEKFEDIKEIVTHSGNEPFDVTVTVDEHLVYTDWEDGSINIMKGEKVERLVKLVDWKPQAICCTSSCELLVAIQLADRSQSKVVRYNDSRVIQEIQYTDSRNLLYSNPAFIEENKNQDIVVSDWTKQAVVVVTKMGKFRYDYRGNPQTPRHKAFNPCGLATDSIGHILVADCDNFVIHVIDKTGQFLLFIDSCHLQYPWGLCIDRTDNLFVAECYSNDVKRIKYQK